MKHILPAILLIGLLSGCQTPGVTVWGDPIVSTTKEGGSKVHTPKMVAINADIIGDIEVPGRLSIVTAKDGSGNFAYTEIPITLKDGTVVVTRQPMVAQVKVASIWDAFFSGLRKNLDAVGQFGATVIGIGAAERVLAPVGAGAGEALNAVVP